MKKHIIFLVFLVFFHCERAEIIKNIYINDVSEPVISLNGTWSICLNPGGKFWEENHINSEWHDIQVPGEVMMQGFPIRHDEPFVYKKSLEVPHEFKEKIVKIRFEGVYSYARVWINGKYIRDHHGGFTAWECDITTAIVPGETASLVVEVTDRADEISYASGYAKHQIGGILRNVSLLALPVHYPEDITIKTDLDDNFQHASLIISGKLYGTVDYAGIKLELCDNKNMGINLENNFHDLSNNQNFQIVNHINDPEKWDAEHPDLYSLKISYLENGILQWQKSYKIGFREISINKNKLLVNGKEVKLRGACRHDIHPLLGRVSTPEYEIKDVMLAKEANMNFIRTSHYPPSDHFLALCDEYGLYVEDETAVCFVGTHRTEAYRPAATENDPDYTQRYLLQLEEMVSNHKNHPSVIMWSIGNENLFGTNFQRSYDWVKAHDDTRPVIFSYPGHVPDTTRTYEILSMHYPGIEGNMDQYGIKTESFGYKQMPVIFDEWAHVACYNNFTVKEDPNIRDFWGRSLDMMWHRVFDADGGLGGAIWGMIDETFMLPEDLPGFNDWWGNIDDNVIHAVYAGPTVGYGEWGIVDTWRRKKPEFWNTKKAYSPVKVLKTDFEQYEEGKPLSVPVYNRFDHTNINELIIKKTYKNQEITLEAPSIEAHTKGSLEIPIDVWDPAEPVILEFLDSKNRLIDKYVLHYKSTDINQEENPPIQAIQIEKRDNWLRVICEDNTSIIFNMKTGLIHEIQTPSDTISISGPYINLRTKGMAIRNTFHEINDHAKNWLLSDFKYQQVDQYIIMNINGTYDNNLPVKFKVTINSIGKIKTQYEINNGPEEYIRELGIKFILENVFDSLYWSRNGHWSYYPPGHLSSETGAIALYAEDYKKYRAQPENNWNLDAGSFYYDGIENELFQDQLSYIAKSTKENVKEYKLLRNSRPALTVMGDSNINCRIAKKDNKINLYINNEMDYVDLGWGNYQNNIFLKKNYTNEAILWIR